MKEIFRLFKLLLECDEIQGERSRRLQLSVGDLAERERGEEGVDHVFLRQRYVDVVTKKGSQKEGGRKKSSVCLSFSECNEYI